MALTFTPSTIAMPSPPSYAAPQTPAVSSNPLTMLGDLANIDLSQQQLKKAQATFASDVSKAQSDAATAQINVGTAETGAAKAKLGLNNEFRNSMLLIASPYASDERTLNAAKLAPNASPEEIKKAKDDVLEMNYEIKQQLKSSGVSNSDIAQHMNYLDDIGIKSPQLYAKALNKGIQTLAGASNIAAQNQPQLATVNGQTTTIVPSRGVVPLQGTQQPDMSVSQSGVNSGVSPGQMNMPPMQYPVRKAGEAYAQLPNEPKDLEDGRSFRGNLVAAQLELPTMRRNVEEVIKEANKLEKTAFNEGAGFTGKIGREVSTFLGTEEGIRYKQLSKDLANAQLTAIKASGGSLNTDAGKQLAAMANGDVTYPPKVLQQIARRTQADMSNLDMQATAAQKFTQLYGDQNMNTFKQMWSANADSKMFELKNIYDNPDMSSKEKDAARIELLGKDKKTLEEYARKWKNIQKLERTGSL